jgi:arylsulfatase A-like enzyme
MNCTRRTFLECLASAPLAGAVVQTPSPPNVVLILTDDQGYGDLACHGNPVIKTPHLDKLHSESVRLTDYHVSPTCAPTRAALLTGRYSNATGVWHTIMGRSLLHPEETTLAECFRANGYITGIFGKWHLGDNYPCRPQDRGFDEVLIHGGGGVWQTPDYFGNDYFDDTYQRNGKPVKFSGFCTDVWFDNAIKFMTLAAQRRQPFFCYLPTNAAHSPTWAPERYNAMYKDVKGLRDPGFYGMITNIDDNVGRLDNFLKSSGLSETTILVFTTDNGTSDGAGVFNSGMRGVKASPYDGGHRVPFFIRWPQGGLTGGRDVPDLTAHVDVLPTLMDLCGLKRPSGKELHGKSLSPLLRQERISWPDRAVVVDSQRLENLVKWRQAAVMTSRWRLVNPSPDGNPANIELYDIQKDPGQAINIATSHPDIADTLKGEYEKWWDAVAQRANEFVRIVLGNKAVEPVRLTAHDWHGEGAEQVWNQKEIRRAPAANGYWAVEVRKSGDYRFELRRWPEELDLPINAPYRDPAFNRETEPGRAISAVKARLRIGGLDRSMDVRLSDKAAVFDLHLEAGPAKLETWLYDKDGTERGAYYVTVRRR